MSANSELQAARARTSFDVASITAMLEPDGRLTVKKAILETMVKDPVFDKAKRPYLSRAESLAAGVAMIKRVLELRRERQWNQRALDVAMELMDETTGLTLHEIAFKPVIASQGSDEQQAYWLPRANEYAILGCKSYRIKVDVRGLKQRWAIPDRTELGHGSNVQRLETTATYVSESEEFEIHTPALTSTKWWIGGLGVLATHAIVQAQLLLPKDGKLKSLGPHLFIMQIRDQNTHQPLRGITIGEIGPKAHAAMSMVDNGFMQFSHVRIPRRAMLSRFAQVSPQGEYITPPHAKLSYGGMIYIRAQMITGLARALSKAVTISTRYLHVRRQFSAENGTREVQVMQYPSVYRRIVPVLLNAYVFLYIGRHTVEAYNAMAARLKDGDTGLLAETHAMSSGLKSYVSAAVVEGCETCRRACGGHGFMASAGMASIYAAQLPSTTYEGDNFILNQQVCRAAVKGYEAKKARGDLQLSSQARVSRTVEGFGGDMGEEAAILLEMRVEVMVGRLAKRKEITASWTDLSWECVPVATAVTEATISRQILSAVSEDARPAEAAILKKVYTLWILNALERALADLLEHSLVSSSFVEELRSAVEIKTRELLPDLIGLTDAFGYSDWELNSVLGGRDGQPYNQLLERAQGVADVNLGDQTYKADIQEILTAGRMALSHGQAKL